MPRPARFDPDAMLDAAAALAESSGPAAVTMSAVTAAIGAPSGSVYHRFADRPALLAALWLRTVHRFQDAWLAVLVSDPPAVDRAAGHVVDWSRRHRAEATVLLAGAAAFGRTDWSSADRAAAARAERAVTQAIRTAAALIPADPELVALAAVDLPYAVVRRHLTSRRPIPLRATALVEQAAFVVLEGRHS